MHTEAFLKETKVVENSKSTSLHTIPPPTDGQSSSQNIVESKILHFKMAPCIHTTYRICTLEVLLIQATRCIYLKDNYWLLNYKIRVQRQVFKGPWHFYKYLCGVCVEREGECAGKRVHNLLKGAMTQKRKKKGLEPLQLNKITFVLWINLFLLITQHKLGCLAQAAKTT